jgi:hypothetical protein
MRKGCQQADAAFMYTQYSKKSGSVLFAGSTACESASLSLMAKRHGRKPKPIAILTARLKPVP